MAFTGHRGDGSGAKYAGSELVLGWRTTSRSLLPLGPASLPAPAPPLSTSHHKAVPSYTHAALLSLWGSPFESNQLSSCSFRRRVSACNSGAAAIACEPQRASPSPGVQTQPDATCQCIQAAAHSPAAAPPHPAPSRTPPPAPG